MTLEADNPQLIEAGRVSARTAFLEVERRSLGTSFLCVLVPLIQWLIPGHTPTGSNVYRFGIFVLLVVFLLRTLWVLRLRPDDVDAAPRRVGTIGSLSSQVLLFSLLACGSLATRTDADWTILLLATQCLCATAVMISYSGIATLAGAMVAMLTALPGGFLLWSGTSSQRPLGLAMLVYGGVLLSYLPRLARERQASIMGLHLLTERAKSLEEARDAALKAVAAKEAFHANLSHEIRTPLNGLVGIVDRLKGMAPSPEQRVLLDQLDRCGQSLLLILNDALDAVRMEAGQLKLRHERFDVDVLLNDAVALFAAQASAKGLELQLQHDARGQALGDAMRIRQVLQNLVGNAVKFTTVGRVLVSANLRPINAAQYELTVAVEDTGPGFDAREASRLFERFSQLGDGAQLGGTGLGLAISRELVTLMGGEIDGESGGLGLGARFVVHIPLTRVETAAEAVAGQHVLVVDDNPLNVAVARVYLESLGCIVDRASGGNEAVRMAKNRRYDAILMDCQMPDLDGFAAAQLIRETWSDARIIAVTAHDDGTTEQKSRAAGMQRLINKPLSSESLRAALGSAPTGQEAPNAFLAGA